MRNTTGAASIPDAPTAWRGAGLSYPRRNRTLARRIDRPGSVSGPADAAGKVLELSAENIAFSASSLESAAGEVTIRFANNDDGVPHNLQVTGGGVDDKTDIDKTDIEPGPINQRLAMTLPSGTYTYVCDVHPQQMTGELIIG